MENIQLDRQQIRIGQITLAAENIDAMQIFYNVALGADMQEIEMYGEKLYKGKLAGYKFVLGPAELLGGQPGSNNFQFDFMVPDAEKWMKVALAFGGKLGTEEGLIEEDGQRYVTVLDPDGNAIVFIEETEQKTVVSQTPASDMHTDSAEDDDDNDDTGGSSIFDFIFGGSRNKAVSS